MYFGFNTTTQGWKEEKKNELVGMVLFGNKSKGFGVIHFTLSP